MIPSSRVHLHGGYLEAKRNNNKYRKNPITICTLLQYAPQPLMGNLWENVSLAVRYAPDLCHSILLARDVIHLALVLQCQCPSVCDGSALAHYS